MNWKRVISGVLAAAMLSALPVQLPVSAEGTEAVGQADGWEELTTLEPLDESNTFFYSKDDQTFHPPGKGCQNRRRHRGLSGRQRGGGGD